ncbi:hypothetical protein M3Y94_00355000 [Aphelenchoides besseyi]|nr:hypothetical protein M3Y94_00355000 [Aphelenchoides besseyi]KAI6235313.1 hypothetical protein M3Y95_00038400 [Aphelenchoides besseyi]
MEENSPPNLDLSFSSLTSNPPTPNSRSSSDFEELATADDDFYCSNEDEMVDDDDSQRLSSASLSPFETELLKALRKDERKDEMDFKGLVFVSELKKVDPTLQSYVFRKVLELLDFAAKREDAVISLEF